MAKVNCPNCGKRIAQELRIYVSQSGFKATALGQKCRCCGALRKSVPLSLDEAQVILLNGVPA